MLIILLFLSILYQEIILKQPVLDIRGVLVASCCMEAYEDFILFLL